MKYKSINEVPQWAKSVISKLLSLGLIQHNNGQFEYPLTDDMLFILLIFSRKGII